MSPISDQLFKSSLRHVRRELKTLGFGKKKIMAVKVDRTLVPSITKEAYFTKDGEIFIPIFQSKRRVRDMLRHEYGHALLFHFPQISAFIGFVSFGHATDRDDYVSKYAMTNPEEDFCETFMVFMKYKGKLPRKYRSPRIIKKWRFLAALPKRLASYG